MLFKLCSEAVLNLVEVGQFFYALPSLDEPKTRSLCRQHAVPRDEEKNCAKGLKCHQMSKFMTNLLFDTRKLVEKKMPEFLMIELLRNARKFY